MHAVIHHQISGHRKITSSSFYGTDRRCDAIIMMKMMITKAPLLLLLLSTLLVVIYAKEKRPMERLTQVGR